MIEALVLPLMIVAIQPEAQPDVVVVCPDAFRDALAPWLEFRREQGRRVAVVSPGASADDVRSRIRQRFGLKREGYVLLVGDAKPPAGNGPARQAPFVPAHYVKAKINIQWGSEPEIATDNWYADLDDDQVPDVAIGRLTADTPEELSTMVAKVLAYERCTDFGTWRRDVNFVAGVGGFGRLADALLESTFKQFITDGLPAGYASTMTYASWQSPYCPAPAEFCDAVLTRLNAGCLFWVYMGHGHVHTLDYLSTPAGRHRIFDVRDVPRLRCTHGSPIAFLMACYTGAFDADEDCLAEQMLRTPGAPVAVLSGSRVTMPYAMAVLGTGLLDECFSARRTTLGEAVLRAKQGLAEDDVASRSRATLDLMAKLVSPAPSQLAEERIEHLHLFNLLGDPLLSLRHPRPIEIVLEPHVAGAGNLIVRAKSPIGGRCRVELIARRDQLTFRPEPRRDFATAGNFAKLNEDYQRANDRRWASAEFLTHGGELMAELAIPANARGPCHVRIYVEGDDDFALGSADVEIRQPSAR